MSDNNKKTSFADRFKKKTGSGEGGGSMAAKFAGKRQENSAKKSSMAKKFQKKRKDMVTAKSMASNKKKKHPEADLIYLVKGIDEGRNAWYYVKVARLKLSLFLKALNDDIIHLEEYGDKKPGEPGFVSPILYSAYGDEPPQEITDKLKKEYGID